MGFPLAMFDYQRGSHLVGIITIALNPVRNHHFWSVKPPIHIPFIRLMHRFDAFCIPSTGTPSLSGQLPAEEVRHFAPGARCIAKAILSSGWQKGSKTAPSCRGCRVWFDHFCDFVEAPPPPYLDCRPIPKILQAGGVFTFLGSGAGKKDAKITRCFWKSILGRF